MNLEHKISQQIAEALLRLNVESEKAVMRARSALGLKASYDGVALAIKKMTEESPLYVGTIVLHGRMCRNMYDEHPGHTYYYADETQFIEAPPYCPLSKAMQISVQMLEAAQLESNQEEEYDGLFYPYSIVLKDQFGNSIQEYAQRHLGKGRYCTGWMEELPSHENWPMMLEEASTLSSEGSFESGWDNHETARQLHAQADSLRRKIEIAKLRLRLIY